VVPADPQRFIQCAFLQAAVCNRLEMPRHSGWSMYRDCRYQGQRILLLAGSACYCGLIPAAFTTFIHLAISFLIVRENSTGSSPTGSSPSRSSNVCTSGMFITFIDSMCSLDTTGRDVRAGARSPIHEACSYPATPASAIVGNSGATMDRFPVVTA